MAPSVLSAVAVIISSWIMFRYPMEVNLRLHWCGWALASLGAVGCLVYHRLRDLRLRQQPDYTTTRYSAAVVVAAAVVGTTVGFLHALAIARWYFS